MAKAPAGAGTQGCGIYYAAPDQTPVAALQDEWTVLCREFEKAGLSGHVIIKAADESVDRRNPQYRFSSMYSMGYALTRSLLDDKKRFTAIAGQNDMMAIGAVDALQDCRESGYPRMSL